MDKQNLRQAEIAARQQDNIAWRTSVREEDTKWRQTIREEDKAWRLKVRKEDTDYRLQSERTAKRCCALSAAAQSSAPDTPPDKIFALARKYEDWLRNPND